MTSIRLHKRPSINTGSASRLLALPLVLLLALALTGCGGDSVQTWHYTLTPDDGAAVFETEKFTLVFQDVPIEQSYEGTVRVAGPGSVEGQNPTTHGAFTYAYSDGVTTFTFAGHKFSIIKGGEALRFGDTIYQLDEDIRIIVHPDGLTEVAA